MKTINQNLTTFLFIFGINTLFLFVLFLNLEPTNATNQPQTNEETAVLLLDSTHPPEDFGGGEWQFGADHLPDEQRSAIEKTLQENTDALGLVDLLDIQGATAVSFTFPLTAADHFTDFGFHAISNFVDHIPGVLDYNCGSRTYNGHKGTDYFLWPFMWNKMDNEAVQVVAAAAGTIVYKQDGYQDRSCTWQGAPSWNAIVIQHIDGSEAWYGHLKRGSILTKTIGDTVSKGDYLALVGSSGMSTGPHLHFELWQDDTYTQVQDPYSGGCNTLNANSWWQTQQPYYDSAINKLTTGNARVSFQACSTHDFTNEQTTFQPGDSIYFTAYYRDQLGSQQSQYTIYRPDNSIFQQWTHNGDKDYYNASYWYWEHTIPSNEQEGTWKFSVDYESVVYEQPFTVAAPVFITVTNPSGGEEWLPTETHTITWQSIYPNNVKIDLYKGNIYSTTLADSLPHNTQFTWPIPFSTPLAFDYQIRISDVTSPTIFKDSSHFAIGITDKVYLPAILRE